MLVGTLRLPDEPFLKFVERARPDIVVMGAFGAPQWAAEEDPQDWIAKWRTVFERMHRSNVKVVGMIELLNVGNSPKAAEKFLHFYQHRWDTKLLGKKPAAKAASLLERRTMPADKQTGAYAPRGCAINPNWRAVEKALVKALIDAGIDGFITHRNMFGECACPFCHAEHGSKDHQHRNPKRERRTDKSKSPARTLRVTGEACKHCSGGFRRWLADRYDRSQLKSRFGIGDLKSHRFSAIYGHHRNHEKLPTPIQLEGMKYARHAIKECFDDVFVKFARGLKNDLIVAQWNHMPYFDELHLDGGHIPKWRVTTFAHASADERWSLPVDLWGRGEDFYWYCNWGTCQNTQLGKKFLADITLYAKLLRSQVRGKPYVINKYDFYRPRNMMAEAMALGMIPGAIKVPYASEEDARTMLRYFEFFKRHRPLFHANNGQTMADVLLVYPRTATHTGDALGLEFIELAGRSMIIEHIQFDLVPDDLLADVQFAKYRAIVATNPSGLSAEKLAPFFQAGGSVIALAAEKEPVHTPAWRKLRAHVVSGLSPHTAGTPPAAPFVTAIERALGKNRPRFAAPYTVEAHVYQEPGKVVVHLVNYNHKEKARGRSVVEREAPIAAGPIRIELPLPNNQRVSRIEFLDPDTAKPRNLRLEQLAGRVRFETPSFSVYGICVIEFVK